MDKPQRKGKFRRASAISTLYGNTIFMTKEHENAVWISGFLFFDEDMGFDSVKEIAIEKLLSIPRFRSRYDFKKKGFIELDLETEIDMSYHVELVEEELELQTVRDDYVGEVYKNFQFDGDKPLWRLTYFPKLKDGRSLLLTKIAHCIGDGIAQIEILYRILDPVESEGKDKGASQRPPEKRKKNKSVYGPLNKTRIFIGGVFDAFFGIFGSMDSPSPLRRPDVRKVGKMRAAFTEKIPIEKIKDLKSKYEGTTINDILVAILTLAINSAFAEVEQETGKPVLKNVKKIRAGFAINMRKRGQSGFRDGSPNNDVAQGLLKFYTEYKSRPELVWKVKRQTDMIKLSPSPAIQQKIAKGLVRLLPLSVATYIFIDFHNTTTALLSNVPGPAKAAKVKGYTVQDMEFLASAPIGCYIGLLSYNGQVSCGINIEETVAIDPNQFAKHWKSEFEKLYEETMAYDGMVPQPRTPLLRI